MQFTFLLTLSIQHPYYREACKDFEFVLPSDSIKLLNGGKLLLKVRDGKLYGLIEVDQSNAPIVLIAQQTLRIGLKLLNPSFTCFTALPFNPSEFCFVYQNSSTSNALDGATKAIWVGQVFSHSLISTLRPVTVTLKTPIDQVLHTQTIEAVNDRATVAYDLTGQPAGLYRVEETDSSTTKTTMYYFDAELYRQSLFGIVEIKIDNTFYTTPPAFTIAFTPRQDMLKYYIIAKNFNDTEFNQLIVSDAGFTEEGRPRIDFTKVPVTAFTVDDLSPTVLSRGDAKIILFKSQVAVSRSQTARKKIQLLKNGDALISHLPQPSADKTTADFVIQLAKP